MQGMIDRTHKKLVEDALAHQAGVVLLGPRQVGKTTLAQDIAESRDAVYLDMERSADRQVLEEPDLYLDEQMGRLVVIDEVQLVPDLFKALRGQVDRRRRLGHRFGQFLLLGSASNTLLQQSAESLAGRVSYHELTPFMLPDTGLEAISALWLRGGFPDSFLSTHDRASLTWREDFIRTYLERDIPSFGLRIPAETLRRFWTMLAHEQGGLLNAAKLARKSWGVGAKYRPVSRSIGRSDACTAFAALAFQCGEAVGQIVQGVHSRFRAGARVAWY